MNVHVCVCSPMIPILLHLHTGHTSKMVWSASLLLVLENREKVKRRAPVKLYFISGCVHIIMQILEAAGGGGWWR